MQPHLAGVDLGEEVHAEIAGIRKTEPMRTMEKNTTVINGPHASLTKIALLR